MTELNALCITKTWNYENLGLTIKEIHHGIKFEEHTWLKDCNDLNTNLRAQTNNEFEKDFLKLMNSSVFGKKMENIRKRVDTELVKDQHKAEKLAGKVNFQHCTISDENFAAIHIRKKYVTSL